MTRLITFEVPEEEALNFIDAACNRFGRTGAWLVSAKRVEDHPIIATTDDDLSDDEIAQDFARIRSQMDQVIANVNALGELSPTDTDPTPPQGITRSPHGARKGYYVTRKNVTQGSGQMVPGLERVPCASCGAGSGEVCSTERHEGYRRGYGHALRRKAHARLSE